MMGSGGKLIRAAITAAASTAAVCPSGAATESAFPEKAIDVIRAYSAAHERLDVEATVKLTHTALILRLGGMQQFKAMQEKMFAGFKALGGFQRGSEMLGQPSETFRDGDLMMLGVPAIRKSARMNTTPLVYVAFSYDAGETWSVLGMSCTDEKWLRALAPSYKGVPDILGMGNPAAMASVTAETFDEAQFLKGPRWQHSR